MHTSARRPAASSAHPAQARTPRLASFVLAIAAASTCASNAIAQEGGAPAPAASAAPAASPAPVSAAPAYAPPPSEGLPPAVAPPSYTADEMVAPKQPRFGVFIDPLNLLITRTFGLEGSLALHRAIALNVGVQYASVKANDASGEDTTIRAYGIRGGVQIFPVSTRALRGFYLYPRFTYVTASSDATKAVQSASGSGYEVAAMAGYQWNWRNGFAIRLGGGVRHIDLEVEAKSTVPGAASSKVSTTGTYPILEFALGWTF